MDMHRQRQIDTLRRLMECREISASEFHANVKVKTGESYTLTVRLPSTFPRGAPEITIAPPCKSPFIDSQSMSVVKYHDSSAGGWAVGLATTWNLHKDVGVVVNHVRDTLFHNPPERTGGHQTEPPANPTCDGGDDAPAFESEAGAAAAALTSPPGSAETVVPPMPSAFPELKDMSSEKLQELLDDEGAFVTFFNQLPLITELDTIETSLRDDNVRLARENLMQKEPLERMKEDLLAQHEILHVQKREYDEKQTRLQQMIREFSRSKILERLEQAKTTADAESRDLQRAFRTSGCDNVEDFVRDYQALRERYHVLKFKLDKLREASS